MPAKAAKPAKPVGGSSGQPDDLGPSLRALRQARDLSLAEVAKGTGLSGSFISLVENAKSDITIGRLVRLLDFYGVSIVDLMSGEGGDAYPQVVAAEDQKVVASPAKGVEIFMLTPDTQRVMQPLILEFAAGASFSESGTHPGEGFVHVLEGKLRLELEGAEPRVLSRGDSAYYPNERPRSISNASEKRPLRILTVDTPPTL